MQINTVSSLPEGDRPRGSRGNLPVELLRQSKHCHPFQKQPEDQTEAMEVLASYIEERSFTYSPPPKKLKVDCYGPEQEFTWEPLQANEVYIWKREGRTTRTFLVPTWALKALIRLGIPPKFSARQAMSNPRFRVPYLSLYMPGGNRRSYELGRVIAKATSRQRVGYVAENDLCRLIVTDNGCFRRPTSAWETIKREYKRTYCPDDLSIYFA